MKKILEIVSLAFAATLLFGCSEKPNSNAQQAQITSLQNRVNALEIQTSPLQGMQQQLNALQTNTNNLWQVQSAVISQAHETVSFDPITDQGYQILDIGIGRIMVSIQDIKSYADGVKVELLVGNPSSEAVTGLAGEITYGPATAELKNSVTFDAWNAKQKKVQTAVPSTLLPARWNRVTITLPGVRASELGRLVLTLKGNTVNFVQ